MSPKLNTKHHYAVIMAGGSGTRMWPLSRKNNPKQFNKVIGSQTMLQMMYQQLREVFEPSKIFVQTAKKFREQVEQQLLELPKENILLEPEARETAPAFGFATAAILNRDPEARIGVFYSDHIIKNIQSFVKSVQTAYRTIEDFPKYIVMIGVKPTFPHTGLGYIQMSSQAKMYAEGEAFYVDRFIEKPDHDTAERFTKSWEYLWNTGYKVYSGKNFFKWIDHLDPDMGKTLRKISRLMAQPDKEKEVEEAFKTLRKITFEYLATEKLSDLLVVPSDMEWSDIGDWDSLHDMLMEINGHHMIARGNHVGLDSENCLIYGGERMIATLGLRDIVIVDTGDVLLVADKKAAKNMKPLIKKLEEQDKHVYL